MKQFLSTIKIVTLGLILALGVGYVSAAGGWVGPTTSPTGGNIEPPVNVSATNQVKSGAFGVGPSLNLTGANAGILAAQKSVLSFGNVVAAGTSNVGGNIFAGLGSLLGAYNGTHDNGAVSADWFCLSPAGGGCINAWPTGSGTGGSGLPNGTITQTLRHNGTTWIASGSLLNDGTNVLVPTGGLRVGQAGGQIPPAGSILANGLIKTFGNTTATNNGDIGASRFCLPGTNPSGGCITSWPTGGSGSAITATTTTGIPLVSNINKFVFENLTLTDLGSGQVKVTAGSGGTTLTGLTNQTIRFSATNTPTANSTLTNDGTRVAIGTSMADADQRLSVNNGSLHINRGGTDALFLNNLAVSGTTDTVAIISNTPKLNFWSSDSGGHNSDVWVRNATVTDLANGTSPINGHTVCANNAGKLILCTVDECPNIPGNQATVPTGLELNAAGNCIANEAVVFSPQFNATCVGETHTWTVPANIYRIRVDAWGAGGDGGLLSGGSTSIGGITGTGGGGGGYSTQSYNVTPGQVLTYEVGCNPRTTNGLNGTSTVISSLGFSVGGGTHGNQGGATTSTAQVGVGGTGQSSGNNGQGSIQCPTPSYGSVIGSAGGTPSITVNDVLSLPLFSTINFVSGTWNGSEGNGGTSQQCGGTISMAGSDGLIVISY